MLMIPLHEQPIDTTENIFQRDKVMMVMMMLMMIDDDDGDDVEDG